MVTVTRGWALMAACPFHNRSTDVVKNKYGVVVGLYQATFEIVQCRRSSMVSVQKGEVQGIHAVQQRGPITEGAHIRNDVPVFRVLKFSCAMVAMAGQPQQTRARDGTRQVQCGDA